MQTGVLLASWSARPQRLVSELWAPWAETQPEGQPPAHLPCPCLTRVPCPGKAGRRSSLCCKSSRLTLLVRVATYSFTCDLLLHQTPPPQPLPCRLLRNFKVCHVWMAPLCYLEFFGHFPNTVKPAFPKHWPERLPLVIRTSPIISHFGLFTQPPIVHQVQDAS